MIHISFDKYALRCILLYPYPTL